MRNGGIGNAAGRGARTTGALALGLLAIGLCLLLVACSGGGANASPTRTPVASVGTAGSPTATDQVIQTPLPFPTSPIGGTPGTLGAADFCNQQLVTATLPSTIPTYPGAQMHLGQVNGGTGEFGLCTTDSIQTAGQFYADQLPSHNWQQVNKTTLQSFIQLTASSGNVNLVINIGPSAAVPGDTLILIIYSGS